MIRCRLVALQSLISFLFIVGSVDGTLCVVTKWGEWSECMGSCKFAQQVRNRDVLRPPFPETTNGEVLVRPCPSLYETRECQPKECQSREETLPMTAPTTTQKPRLGPAKEEFFRDLPIIRSVTNDNTKSPFESDTKIIRPIWRKVPEKPVEIRRPTQTSSRRSTQAHRPNCTLEMNSSCCRLVREECPDGSVPKKLIRWFRLPGEQLCRPYHYPHCSSSYEKQEKPVLSEAICLQTCFSEAEQAILPSLRII